MYDALLALTFSSKFTDIWYGWFHWVLFVHESLFGQKYTIATIKLRTLKKTNFQIRLRVHHHGFM